MTKSKKCVTRYYLINVFGMRILRLILLVTFLYIPEFPGSSER